MTHDITGRALGTSLLRRAVGVAPNQITSAALLAAEVLDAIEMIVPRLQRLAANRSAPRPLAQAAASPPLPDRADPSPRRFPPSAVGAEADGLLAPPPPRAPQANHLSQTDQSS